MAARRARRLPAPGGRGQMSGDGARLALRPRLETALSLLQGRRVVADIGCDHGRLCCALLQRDAHARCIASDVSAPSLQKARELAQAVGLAERISFRCGDGLSVLEAGEAEAVALLGMGGTLMARLLDACPVPMMGAGLLVLQPMRAEADIRSYLYARGYRVEEDRVVRDAGRLYQVFSVRPPCAAGRDAWPAGFPEDCFTVGYRAFERREPLLVPLVKRQLDQCEKRLASARGTPGEAPLAQKARQMRAILERWEEV